MTNGVGCGAFNTICVFMATGAYTGLVPERLAHHSPHIRKRFHGTGAGFIGTIWGACSAWFWSAGWMSFAWIVLGFFVGMVTVLQAEKVFQRKDDSGIGVEEIVGFWVASALLPRSVVWFGLAFVVFRLFDTIKGPLIRWAENFSGGFGVMLDDLLAGALTLLTLLPFRFLIS